jgi:hypothetical protein
MNIITSINNAILTKSQQKSSRKKHPKHSNNRSSRPAITLRLAPDLSNLPRTTPNIEIPKPQKLSTPSQKISKKGSLHLKIKLPLYFQLPDYRTAALNAQAPQPPVSPTHPASPTKRNIVYHRHAPQTKK